MTASSARSPHRPSTIDFGDFARHVVGSLDLPATRLVRDQREGHRLLQRLRVRERRQRRCWLVQGGFFADSTTVTLTSSHQYLLPSGPLQVVGTTFANFALTTAIGGGGTITVQCLRGNGGSGQS